jgi:hypothetical protein
MDTRCTVTRPTGVWVHEGRELLGQQGSVNGMCVCGSAENSGAAGDRHNAECDSPLHTKCCACENMGGGRAG